MPSDLSISAYIPCFNDAATLRFAIESVRTQSVPVDELFVVDDGSSDDSCRIAEAMGVRTIRHSQNLGRGAVRARAMTEAHGELVLSCDGTSMLEPDFVKHVLPWFEDGKIAAVFGLFCQPPARSVVERWRGRHLFRLNAETSVQTGVLLATGGTLLRKSAALSVGNFDASLVRAEDRDIGQRLLDAGWNVVRDPRVRVMTTSSNTLWEVLERYWRWNAVEEKPLCLGAYLRQILYSARSMAVTDLRAGDPLAALISLLSPHYQFARSLFHRNHGKK